MSAQPIPGPAAYSDEWFALRVYDPARTERPVIFGASEAAEALGLSPYSAGPLELFLKKTGRIPPQDDNQAMEMGRLLEGPVLTLYERRTGRTLTREHPLYFHGEHTFMGATPDGLTCESEPKAVDAKTSTYRRYNEFASYDDDKFGAAGTDQMPIDYILQAQQQAAVLNVARVDFPVLFDGRTLRIYEVARDEALIDAILSAEKELAERIANDDPPEASWRHPRTRECLRALYELELGTEIVLSTESRDRWVEISRRKEQIKALESRNEEDKNRILAEIGSAEFARYPGGQKGLARSVVKPTVFTEADLREVERKLGQTKRKGYEMLLERKAKR